VAEVKKQQTYKFCHAICIKHSISDSTGAGHQTHSVGNLLFIPILVLFFLVSCSLPFHLLNLDQLTLVLQVNVFLLSVLIKFGQRTILLLDAITVIPIAVASAISGLGQLCLRIHQLFLQFIVF